MIGLAGLPYVLGAALLLAGGSYLLGRHHGSEAEEAATALREQAAYRRGVALNAAIDAGIDKIGAVLRDGLESSRTAETGAVRTVTRIVRENPDFAAVRRPPDLQRVRDEQLARIAAATAAD